MTARRSGTNALALRSSSLIAALLAGAAAPIAHADVASFFPSKDNSIFLTEPPASNGAGQGIFCGRTAARINITHRGLMRFNVALIPPGSTINSVSLSMYLVMAAPFGQANAITLHRLLADWGEGTSVGFGGSGAEPTPGDATWQDRFFLEQEWATPGGDFDAAPVASQVTSTAGTTVTWTSTPELVALVQQWVSTPATNFGLLLHGDESSPDTARHFASREYEADPTRRPTLVIDYTLPGPVCVADWNQSGGVDSQDFFDFITAFFAGNADVNNSGTTDSQDFFDFLTAFFAGC